MCKAVFIPSTYILQSTCVVHFSVGVCIWQVFQRIKSQQTEIHSQNKLGIFDFSQPLVVDLNLTLSERSLCIYFKSILLLEYYWNLHKIWIKARYDNNNLNLVLLTQYSHFSSIIIKILYDSIVLGERLFQTFSITEKVFTSF